MSLLFFAFGVWLLAAVPLGVLIGWMCSLNRLSEAGCEDHGRTTIDPSRARGANLAA